MKSILFLITCIFVFTNCKKKMYQIPKYEDSLLDAAVEFLKAHLGFEELSSLNLNGMKSLRYKKSAGWCSDI